MRTLLFTVFLHFLFLLPLYSQPATKEDIKIVLEQMDKRFELMEKRFEQIEKRFELMEKRFEQIDKRFELMEKRFEQIDKRFEQMDKRFDQLMWMIGIWIPIAFGIVNYILRRIQRNEDRVYDLVSDHRLVRESPDTLIHILEKADSNQRKRIRDLISS